MTQIPLPSVTPALAQQVWDQMDAPSTRRVAHKLRQAGRAVSHETIRRWQANGWRPLAREQHPLDAARAALNDAIPVLTLDPLTTADSIRAAGDDAAALAQLSDAELIHRARRELAIATVVVAQALMLEPDIATNRPTEVSVLAHALAKCVQAVDAGFAQVNAMQGSTTAKR
jgi:hypothetical protein